VALLNGGGIRGDRTYEAGVRLTRRDAHRIAVRQRHGADRPQGP
jgi:hypothetical protein